LVGWSVVSYAISCMRLLSPGYIHELQACKHEKQGKDQHMATGLLHFPVSTSSKQSQTHCSHVSLVPTRLELILLQVERVHVMLGRKVVQSIAGSLPQTSSTWQTCLTPSATWYVTSTDEQKFSTMSGGFVSKAITIESKNTTTTTLIPCSPPA
jgi:hypothetical protein